MVSILSHALAFVSPTIHSSTVLPKMAHLIEYKYNPAWISSNCFCVHCNVVLCSVSVMSRILKRISMLYHILKNHTHSAVGRCIRNSTRSHLYSTSSLLTSLLPPFALGRLSCLCMVVVVRSAMASLNLHFLWSKIETFAIAIYETPRWFASRSFMLHLITSIAMHIFVLWPMYVFIVVWTFAWNARSGSCCRRT